MNRPIRTRYKLGRKPRKYAATKTRLFDHKAEKWKTACEELKQHEQDQPPKDPAA